MESERNWLIQSAVFGAIELTIVALCVMQIVGAALQRRQFDQERRTEEHKVLDVRVTSSSSRRHHEYFGCRSLSMAKQWFLGILLTQSVLRGASFALTAAWIAIKTLEKAGSSGDTLPLADGSAEGVAPQSSWGAVFCTGYTQAAMQSLLTLSGSVFTAAFLVLLYYWALIYFYSRMRFKFLGIAKVLLVAVGAAYGTSQLALCVLYFKFLPCGCSANSFSLLDTPQCQSSFSGSNPRYQKFAEWIELVRAASNAALSVFLAVGFLACGLKVALKKSNASIPLPIPTAARRRVPWY
jgi:hypothetical protein